MRIQTRLFLGVALPVLALVGVQWWLHQRQLGALERELGAVASSVGRDLLAESLPLLAPVAEGGTADPGHGGFAWVSQLPPAGEDHPAAGGAEHVEIVVITEGSETEAGTLTRRVVRRRVVMPLPEGAGSAAVAMPDVSSETDQVQRLELKVERGSSPGERFLVVRTSPGDEKRVPIPVSATARVVRSTLRQGLALSAGLLVLGVVASGVVAHRLARPLRSLARGAEALGRGELGARVAVTASGEVGDLERAFNRMAEQLEGLERERAEWRQREHLAQLGDLARGLAHTLRNPLNTLGLATEELAAAAGTDGAALAATARGQIRRVDRWLRSFLVLGAGEAAPPEPVEVAALVEEVVLEAVQQGAAVDLRLAEEALTVRVVPAAVRAALANLVANAVEASPAGGVVEVVLGREGDEAVVAVSDRGPGLPNEVRQRLFQPHVTTKVEGSGMGLFLARQLVVALSGGRLEVRDRDGGGTVAAVALPLAGTVGAADGA